MWVRVGNDSSIYVGMDFEKPERVGVTTKKHGGQAVNFKYGEVDFDSTPKSSRVSFKSDSGEIHFGEGKMIGTPI